MGQRVLVTGGAGYVGSHACKALSRAGYEPIAFDNLVNGHRSAVLWGPLELGDIRDEARVAQVVQSYRPVAVLHFAAFASVAESVADPEKYYQNNVIGSLRLLQVMRSQGIEHIVFSSSCATYGVPDVVPIAETQRQTPANPYGMTKLAVEQALAGYSAAYGLRYVALRYFNAAGADADGEIGETHDPETHAIPLAILAAAGVRQYFEIFGTDYPTDDGTAVRDYVHVTDLADAHVQALAYLLAGGEAIALNLGTGIGHSVRQVVATVERVGGRSVPVRVAARRPGDPPVLVADAARSRQVLGWQPRYLTLEPMVTTALAWLAKHSSSADAG